MWRQNGVIEADICKNLGISHETLAKYKREHSELFEALKTGKEDTDGDGIGDACCCVNRGNVDGEGGINVADLTYLVDYLFFEGPAPPPCP